ncbi:MAG: hypothetical protein IPK68_02420 [Bdellovibrionales bacterium]|nr:hypothetical protein [Bdellovibrionales bacterium]
MSRAQASFKSLPFFIFILFCSGTLDSWAQKQPQPTPQPQSQLPNDLNLKDESTDPQASKAPVMNQQPAADSINPLPTNQGQDITKELNLIQIQQGTIQSEIKKLSDQLQNISKETKDSSTEINLPNKHETSLSVSSSRDTPLSFGLSAELINFIDDRELESPVVNTSRLSPLIVYRFNQNIIFNSRFSFENTGSEVHAAGSSQKGQTRVEVAYLDLLYTPRINLRVGQQFIPLGLVNPRQDGLSFYSVHRPEIETYIIPSPWSENGITLWGNEGELHYQLAAYNSLSGKYFTEGTFIRGGRQNGQLAKAENLAGVGRLDLISSWGTIGISAFVGSTSQDQPTINDGTVSLYEGHLQMSWRAFTFSALVSEGTIQDSDSISIIAPGNPSIPEKANGYYICLAADLLRLLGSRGGTSSLPLFVNYSQYDLNAEVPTGTTADPELNRSLTTVGLNYRPQENIAFKLDYQFRKNKLRDENDVFAMGISLNF